MLGMDRDIAMGLRGFGLQEGYGIECPSILGRLEVRIYA
jgi:hypothetical protein